MRATISFYPESKMELTDRDKKFWLAMFREFSDRNLLAALAKHVREGNKYPPNAAELYKQLSENKRPELSASTYLGQDKDVYDRYMAHIEKCRKAGIPTAVEAKKQGMGYKAWCVMADEAGI